MKLNLSKRGLVIVTVMLLVIGGLGVYAYGLNSALATEKQINETNTASLKASNERVNEKDEYIDTICAEYRKLYQSDRALRYSDQLNIDKYIGLPGSASGRIDKCYLPQ